MKDKGIINQGYNICTVLPLGCWAQGRYRRKGIMRRLVERYRKGINAVLAATAIGVMFLMGIWGFLSQQPEF